MRRLHLRTILAALALVLAHGASGAAAAAPQAAAAAAAGSASAPPSCTAASNTGSWSPFSKQPSFPSSGTMAQVTGDKLHSLILQQARSKTNNEQLVIFFYLEDCPNSMAMKAVVECLPAFFPTDVRFVSVEYSDLTLLQLMTNTLHALPVLQVTTRGKRYRYRGRHKLGPLVAFLAQALAREPLAPAEAAEACAHDASARGGWRCERTDGEATAEELTGQPSPLLYLSTAFLAVQGCAWCWRRRRRQVEARRRAVVVPAAAAAPAPRPAD